MKQKKKRSRISGPVIYNSPSNLPFDNFLVQNDTTECEPNFLVRACGCGRTTILTGCMRKDCTLCTKRLNARRAENAYGRFKLVKRIRSKKHLPTIFCYTDFTIPPALRQTYVDKKKWQRLRCDIWEMLHYQYGAVFALEGTHPIGEKNPNIFHPHLNFVWIIDDDHNPFIDVDELRGFLQVFLKYIGPVDVWHQYGQDDAQLRHWCKYVSRIFPAFSQWVGQLRWFGDYPDYKQRSECYCDVCQQKFVVIGFVRGSVVKNFEERGFWLGRAPPWEDDNQVTFFKRAVNE